MDTFLTLRLIWWWFQDPQSTVVTFGFETWVFAKLSQLPTTTCHHPPPEYNWSQKLAFDWKRLLDPTYPTRPRIVPRCSFRLAFATFAVLATDNRTAAVVIFDSRKKVWIELLIEFWLLYGHFLKLLHMAGVPKCKILAMNQENY